MSDTHDIPLSSDAIRVLRAIHERGLTVLWSYRVSHPEYDDGTDFPHEDWLIVQREIGDTTHVPASMFCTGARRIRNVEITTTLGQVREETRLQDLAPNGEPLGDEVVVETRYPYVRRGMEDGIKLRIGAGGFRELSAETKFDYTPTMGYDMWGSDYLNVDQVDADDWTEEHIGIRERYTLTEKALALIGGAS